MASKPGAKKLDKKKPKEAPFDKVKYLTDQQLVTNAHVAEMQKEEDALKIKVDVAKEQLKGLKAQHEAKKSAKEQYIRERDQAFRSRQMGNAQATLTPDIEHNEDAARARKMIEEVAANTKMPPADGAKPAATAAPADGYDAHGVHENAWKQYPIENMKKFGAPAGLIEKLRDPAMKRGQDIVAPITTLGKLMDFISPDPKNPTYARQLVDLQGIGPEAATKFGDAQEKFLAEWARGTISVEFAKELAAKDKAFANLYRAPRDEQAKPAGKQLRGGGAKPEVKPKAKPKVKTPAKKAEPAAAPDEQPAPTSEPATDPQTEEKPNDVPSAAV